VNELLLRSRLNGLAKKNETQYQPKNQLYEKIHLPVGSDILRINTPDDVMQNFANSDGRIKASRYQCATACEGCSSGQQITARPGRQTDEYS